MTKVLFVCMGNICRSPTAEGVFTHLVAAQSLRQQMEIDSAGTHAYHIGEAPDARAQQAARQRGIELGSLRGRKVKHSDFEHYDYILAMDNNNYADLIAISPPEYQSKIHLFLDFAEECKQQNIREVPDPYYGGAKGFDYVLDLVEAASRGLLEDIQMR